MSAKALRQDVHGVCEEYPVWLCPWPTALTAAGSLFFLEGERGSPGDEAALLRSL